MCLMWLSILSKNDLFQVDRTMMLNRDTEVWPNEFQPDA